MPAKWLSELFDKYVPDSILEMRQSYSHITPLGKPGFQNAHTVIAGRPCFCAVHASTRRSPPAALRSRQHA